LEVYKNFSLEDWDKTLHRCCSVLDLEIFCPSLSHLIFSMASYNFLYYVTLVVNLLCRIGGDVLTPRKNRAS
ncbi:MAG: hypothetical protein M3M84_06740, partial [Thermoproteota archaeon]|nr:hypothetical protein [Thermoproteota archaeon]